MNFSKHRKKDSKTKPPANGSATTATAAGDERPESPPTDNAVAASAPVAPAHDCHALAQEVRAGQTEFAQMLRETTGQAALQREQLNQVYNAVGHLYQLVSGHGQQLSQSHTAVQQELAKFQMGGPQRAMAGVFAKLFRDLLKHANELDDLVLRNETQTLDAAAQAWFDALRITRDKFDGLLRDWGCTPMPIQVGVEEFDPERHEAVDAEPGDVPANAPAHIVVKVRRRGWIMNEQILQYPQVVVS